MIKLSAFADEADASLEGQIGALLRNGIDYIEVRGINGKNISALTEDEAREYAKAFAEAGIKVWSIGSPIGKVDINCNFEEHKRLLLHICRLAGIFGTDKVRIFSFYNACGEEEKVFSYLLEMVELAAKEGIGLYHENEKDIYGDTLERVQKIMQRVRGLHYVYDPANFIQVGERADITLAALLGHTDYFHIKDVKAESGCMVPAGCGDGRISELIAGIDTDADTVLTLEPHLEAFEGYSDIDGSELKTEYRFAGRGEAFDAAADALKHLLFENGCKYSDGGYIK